MILEHEGLSNLAIMGSSFGGLVAQAFLYKYPNLVSRAVLANTGSSSDDPSFTRKINLSLKLVRILPNFLIVKVAKRSFKKLFSGVPGNELYSAALDEVFAKKLFTKKELICHFEGLIDFQENFRINPETFAEWHGKMLIIMSDDDPGVSRITSEALSKNFPKAQFHTFQGAGHIPALTHREEYLSLILEFLKST